MSEIENLRKELADLRGEQKVEIEDVDRPKQESMFGTNESSQRVGNILGNFIGFNRVSGKSILREFGQKFMGRYPGMSSYVSQIVFGSPDKVQQLQFTYSEMQLVAGRGGHGNNLSGVINQWPIAPLYDYLLTVDLVVTQIINEIARIKNMRYIGSNETEDIKRRVLMPDFRPHFFHTVTPDLGQVDIKGRLKSEGQALGSDMQYMGENESAVAKNKKGIAEDNAVLLSYRHLNNIVALSQGLFIVNFTRTYKLTNDGVDNSKGIDRGAWVNSKSANAEHNIVTPGTILSAQDFQINHYADNRFENLRNTVFRGLPENMFKKTGDLKSPALGGAMATILPDKENKQHKVITDSDFDENMTKLNKMSAIYHCSNFREIAKELHLDLALRNLHMDMQVVFSETVGLMLRGGNRPNDLFALGARSSCPPGHTQLFMNREGKMVSQFVSVPGQGMVRNPEIHGVGVCTKIQNVSDGSRLRVPSLRASSRTTIADLFGAESRRRKPRRRAPRKKPVRKRSSRKKQVKYTARKSVRSTTRKFKGKTVFKGANGGLFVKQRSRTTGKMTRKYI
jgi:hypothetical protein